MSLVNIKNSGSKGKFSSFIFSSYLVKRLLLKKKRN